MQRVLGWLMTPSPKARLWGLCEIYPLTPSYPLLTPTILLTSLQCCLLFEGP